MERRPLDGMVIHEDLAECRFRGRRVAASFFLRIVSSNVFRPRQSRPSGRGPCAGGGGCIAYDQNGVEECGALAAIQPTSGARWPERGAWSFSSFMRATSMVSTQLHLLAGQRLLTGANLPRSPLAGAAEIDRCCSLIPGLGVKLSTIILAGPTVLSAVGACPPHDGVRRRWRINVESAVALLDARKESDDLTTATVPAGTTFPAVLRELCDLLMRVTR